MTNEQLTVDSLGETEEAVPSLPRRSSKAIREVPAMRRTIHLTTAQGKRVDLHLHNWGGGTDRMFRNWTKEPDGWHCVDTGEIGQPSRGFLFSRLSRLATPQRGH